MSVLLDTDTVSAVLTRSPRLDRQQVQRVPRAAWAVSTITVGEILFGVAKSGRHEDVRAELEERFLPTIIVMVFDLPSALVYARLRADLERQGRRLDDPDLRIAATALAHGLTLITGNEKHFARVPELRVENWLR